MRDKKELQEIANGLRKDIIKMLCESKSGHPGGSLSACEILSVLYFDKMNIDPSNPAMETRDRFVLSKGHGAPVLYAALAEKGYFSKDELKKLRKTGAMLQGHPDMKGTPGVDMSTGSLGQGLSAACGMAKSAKISNDDYRVYALIGDGETQEGLIWEATMFAAHYNLDNLTVFLDHNGLQIDGKNTDVMNIDPIDEKFSAFGWNVIEIDGHCVESIQNAVESAKSVKGKPSIIIASTTKGRGVSFMEDVADWHGTAPNADQRDEALEQLRRCMLND